MTELEVAQQAARTAAAYLAQAHVDRPQHVHHKGVVDLVTEVDLACEARIREVLQRLTPHIPVLGEEGGGAEHDSTRWVIDPLDGTTNFVHGLPWFCVSIALKVDGKSVAGVIIDPISGTEWGAAVGQGTTMNGQRVRVSDCRELAQALVSTGFPYDRQHRAAHYLAVVQKVMERAQGIRRAGSAALDLAMVACGRTDAFWEPHLKLWDVAAGTLLVTEAGGLVSNHRGEPLEPSDPCPLAANPWLHEQLLDVLNDGTAP